MYAEDVIMLATSRVLVSGTSLIDYRNTRFTQDLMQIEKGLQGTGFEVSPLVFCALNSLMGLYAVDRTNVDCSWNLHQQLRSRYHQYKQMVSAMIATPTLAVHHCRVITRSVWNSFKHVALPKRMFDDELCTRGLINESSILTDERFHEIVDRTWLLAWRYITLYFGN